MNIVRDVTKMTDKIQLMFETNLIKSRIHEFTFRNVCMLSFAI